MLHTPRGQVPYPQCAVPRARNGHRHMRHHMHTPDRRCVAVHHSLTLARPNVPYPQTPIGAGTHQTRAALIPAARAGTGNVRLLALLLRNMHGITDSQATRRLQRQTRARPLVGLRTHQSCRGRWLVGPIVPARWTCCEHQAPHATLMATQHTHKLAGARGKHKNGTAGHTHRCPLVIHRAACKCQAPIRVRISISQLDRLVRTQQPPAPSPVAVHRISQSKVVSKRHRGAVRR